MGRSVGRGGRLVSAFGVASLAAIAIGAAVCAASGVSVGVWARNLVAWLIGALAAIAMAAAAPRAVPPFVLWVCPAGLAAVFLSAGQMGVHRWIDAGPLHINAALLLLPVFVVALAELAPGRISAWLAAIIGMAILVIQPDASQATALAVSASLVAIKTVRPPLGRAGLVALFGVLAALAWLRPDPLLPVPEVEGVIGLAAKLSPWGAGLMLLGLTAVIAVPVLYAPSLRPAWVLSLCFALWIIAPFLGAFPVPFAGMGLSPIIGAWLGVGLLAGLMRQGQP